MSKPGDSVWDTLYGSLKRSNNIRANRIAFNQQLANEAGRGIGVATGALHGQDMRPEAVNKRLNDSKVVQDTPGSKSNPLPSDYNTVANAKVGQWIKNSKGDVVQLTKEHIDWAKGKITKAAPADTKVQDKSAPAEHAEVVNAQAAMRTQQPGTAMQDKQSDTSIRAEALLTIWRRLHPEEVAKYNAMSTSELKAGLDNYRQNGLKGRD